MNNHSWNKRDVCIYCGKTCKEVEDNHAIQCIQWEKPRFGDGAPGGFGGVNFIEPMPRKRGLNERWFTF
jgi:hypothetical protein